MREKREAKYRVGVIGCGRAGTSRARAFDVHPLCKVVAIADTDAENLALGCRRFGVPGYATYEEMLARESIDIAMPVLPVRANAGAVVAAAEAGGQGHLLRKTPDGPAVRSRPHGGKLPAAGRVPSFGRHGVESSRLPPGLRVGRRGGDWPSAAHQSVRRQRPRWLPRFELDAQVRRQGTGGVGSSVRSRAIPTATTRNPTRRGATGCGGVGGYIRFGNGIECFSSFPGPTWRGLEVVGSEGLICNWNNTGLGLRLFKHSGRGAPLVEEEGVFEQYTEEERGYDDEGWQDPGPVMRAIVEDIVRVLEEGGDLAITSGDDLRHALELAIALRQSHRQGSVQVSLPLADRSLVMYPEKSRWNYKKDLIGRAAYMAQMARQVEEGT